MNNFNNYEGRSNVKYNGSGQQSSRNMNNQKKYNYNKTSSYEENSYKSYSANPIKKQYNNNNNNNEANYGQMYKNNISNKFKDNLDHEDDNDFLENSVIKQQLLDYIYKAIELSNYKYKLLEYEYDLPLLKEKSYNVSANYNGIHSLLVFIKIKDKYLSFIIDRKTLTYNINQIDISKVKIIPIYIRLDESIYKGTIFDGVLLYNVINGIKHFVINDVYCFRGQDMSHDKMTNKMLNISTYLETIKEDAATNNIVFIINKLYNLNEIQQLVNLYIPKSKYNKSIKGIAFYPEFSGTKLIHLFNNCSHDKYEESPEKEKSKNIEPVKISEIKEVRKSNIIVQKESITSVFKMKKTEIIDVYHLFLGEKVISEDKKLFKYKKIGIAYIPTKECSFFCKDLFNKTSNDSVLVECKYDYDKERWIPFKQTLDKKRPDLIDKIENLIKIDPLSS